MVEKLCLKIVQNGEPAGSKIVNLPAEGFRHHSWILPRLSTPDYQILK